MLHEVCAEYGVQGAGNIGTELRCLFSCSRVGSVTKPHISVDPLPPHQQTIEEWLVRKTERLEV